MTVEILKTYNLINYDHDMSVLYDDLKKFINQNYPTGVNFKVNQRLVFIHTDLDYFLNEHSPGFTLYNLQVILKKLDISNYFCAVISNIPNYKKYTKLVRDLVVGYDVPIRAITSLYNVTVFDQQLPNLDANDNLIHKSFVCLNRVSRFHRTFFVAKLFNKNLHDKGLVSCHSLFDSPQLANSVPDSDVTNNTDSTPGFLYAKPFSRSAEHLTLFSESNRLLVADFSNRITKFQNFQEPLIDVNDKLIAATYQNSILQQALIYVATETTVTYPEPFVSKITFKSIVEKRPFILVGCPGLLNYVKTLGFKTFDQWWDESYDQKADFELRVDAIIKILDRFSSYSTKQLQDICREMTDVLEYNFNHFTQNFLQQEQDKISQVLKLEVI